MFVQGTCRMVSNYAGNDRQVGSMECDITHQVYIRPEMDGREIISTVNIIQRTHITENHTEYYSMAGDLVTDRFNALMLTDMSEEVCMEIQLAASQYTVLQGKLRQITVRLKRALNCTSPRMAVVANLELQRDTTQGVMCMYRQYLEKKLHKLDQLHRFRLQTCGY